MDHKNLTSELEYVSGAIGQNIPLNDLYSPSVNLVSI